MVHQRVGLEPKWYLGAYSNYLCGLLPQLATVFGPDTDKLLDVVRGPRYKLYSDGRLYDVSGDPLENTPIETGLNKEAEVARSELKAAMKQLRESSPRKW